MISFYIHIPFCIKKCDYCDFLSFPASDDVKEAYVNALCKEIGLYSDIIGCDKDNTVSTIFFGGGTPSLLTPIQLGNILSSINTGFSVSKDAEISLECNPGTVDIKKLRDYKALGVNRLSIGLQSAVDSELKTLGRIHDHDRFALTYSDARKAGFDNINIDIMSAIPGQDKESYKRTLTEVVDADPEHVSSYSLIIEEGTKFHDLYNHDTNVIAGKNLPSEEEEREMYYMTRCVLGDAGYHRYEISNYSKEGYECRHNNAYWTGGEYIGAGLGASSHLMGYRYRNITDMSLYLKRYENDIGINFLSSLEEFVKDERYHIEITHLSVKDIMEEYMYLGLRRMAGVSMNGFTRKFGRSMDEVYGLTVKRLVSDGLILIDDDMIKLTDFGIDVSNVV
ncbi:MAG: radical SAM family heme chaperone HemW, partial [Lachnospiraceae bacterium]|nr:radical SAM family heme chaperone HemW [Lachnospiraceae bacterium]